MSLLLPCARTRKDRLLVTNYLPWYQVYSICWYIFVQADVAPPPHYINSCFLESLSGCLLREGWAYRWFAFSLQPLIAERRCTQQTLRAPFPVCVFITRTSPHDINNSTHTGSRQHETHTNNTRSHRAPQSAVMCVCVPVGDCWGARWRWCCECCQSQCGRNVDCEKVTYRKK